MVFSCMGIVLIIVYCRLMWFCGYMIKEKFIEKLIVSLI